MRGHTIGGTAMGTLRGLRGAGAASSFHRKTEKMVAAAKELNTFLQGFVEQVREGTLSYIEQCKYPLLSPVLNPREADPLY